MKQFGRKLISSLLALVMVISLIPVQVFAAEEESIIEEIELEVEPEVTVEEVPEVTETPAPEESPEAAEEVTADIKGISAPETEEPSVLEESQLHTDDAAMFANTGTCGENLTWTLSDDGVLTISGTGAMWDYTDNSGGAPWEGNEIKEIVFDGAITYIGNYAFAFCFTGNSFTDVTIPETVTKIGDYAFLYCDLQSVEFLAEKIEFGKAVFEMNYYLTDVRLPSKQQVIGNEMFMDCKKLTHIALPESVTDIGVGAFKNCIALETITIPTGVAKIGESAFSGCTSLTDVYFDESESKWNQVVVGDYNDPLISATIHYGYICEGKCGESKTFTLSYDGILTISGTGAMPDYEMYVRPGWYMDIQEIRSIVIEEGITHIGNYAFSGCDNLISVSIPKSVTSIGSRAFSSCSNLGSMSIPEGVTSIGDYAFYNCGNLSSVTIPETITSIGGYVFSDCGNLNSVVLPSSMTSIGGYVFSGCNGLTSMTLPEGVVSIDSYAFENCSNLESITLPLSIKEISTAAFSGCSALTDVYYTGTKIQWNEVTVADDNAEFLAARLHVTVAMLSSGSCGENLTYSLNSEGVLTISGTGAMMECTVAAQVPWFEDGEMITSVVIESGVTSIGVYAFYDCKNLTNVTIPETVTSIGNSAFNGCTALTSIIIPSGVTSIGSNAFNGCGFTRISLPTGIETIEAFAFYGCSKLTSINIPANVTSIGNNAFYGCTGLTDISISESVTSIGDAAFCKCTGLTSVTLPSKLTVLNDQLFYGCSSLSNVVIPNGVREIGSGAFWGCGRLKSVTIPSSVRYIRDEAFAGCSSLTSVELPRWITELEGGVFYNCSNLQSIIIPSNVRSIEKSAFYGCVRLTSITIPGSVTEIGESAFQHCGRLSSITIPASVKNIGDSAFSGCGSLTSIVIPDGVPNISETAFRNCSALSSITIPASVTSIGKSAFSGCSQLTDVYYDGAENQWDAITIGSSNTPLTSATLHYTALYKGSCGTTLDYVLDYDGVLTISGSGEMTEYASASEQPWYSGRDSIRSVVIKEGVTSISDYAFSGCTELITVKIPFGVTAIGDSAFYDCNALAEVNYSGALNQWKTISLGTNNDCLTSDILRFASLRAGNCGSSVSYVLSNEGVLTISGTGAMSNWYSYSSVPWIDCRDSVISIVVSSGVTTIGDNAFYGCVNVESVQIANSLQSIGKNAFYNCEKLSEIELPGNVISIGEYAFYGCSALESMKIPQGVTEIKKSTFSECEGLLSVEIPESVTIIGSRAFSNCIGLDNVMIPQGVTSIETYAFDNCGNLKSITISESLKTIKAYCFERCSGLTDVYYDGSNQSYLDITIENNNTYFVNANLHCGKNSIGDCGTNLTYEFDVASQTLNIDGIGEMADYTSAANVPWNRFRNEIKKLVIGDHVTSIGAYAFSDCEGLVDVIVPDGVTKIGKSAFDQCVNLKSITLPETLNSVASHGFNNCSALTDVNFDGSHMIWVSISIGEKNACLLSAKLNCSKRSAGVCGQNVQFVFEPKTNTLLISGRGEMAEYKGYDVPWSAINSYIENAVISSGVTSVGTYSFYSCSNLISVEIPKSVKTIGNYAFAGCSELVSLEIPNGVTEIGEFAFEDCTKLLDIKLPQSIEYIGYFAFRDCDSLVSVVLPEGITEVDVGLFEYCSNLQSVIIPEGVKRISVAAFEGCDSLRMVTIPRSVGSVFSSAFYGCNALSDVYYGGSRSMWASVDIGEYNDPLRYANIHYSSAIEQPNIKSVTSRTDGILLSWSGIDGAEMYRVFVYHNNLLKFTYDTNSTEYLYSEAVSGESYMFAVCCVDGGGEQLSPLCISENYHYLAPTAIKETVIRQNGIFLSWDEISGGDSYEILQYVDKKWKVIDTVRETEYLYTKVNSGKTYTFTVRAVSEHGTRSPFDTVGKKITYVAQPEIKSAVNTTSGVKLSWSKVSGAKNYRIFMKSGEEWIAVGNTTGTSYTCSNLVSGEEYTFSLRCTDSGGTVYTSTMNQAGMSAVYMAAPVISGLYNTANGVKISWNAVDGAASYTVLRKVSDKWQTVEEVTDTEYVFESVSSNKSYTFAVRANSAEGVTSAYDTTGKKITYIAQPTIKSVVNAFNGLKVTWGKVSGASKYRVYVQIDGQWVKAGDTDSTSYTYKNGESGKFYSFTVCCLNSKGAEVSPYDTEGAGQLRLAQPSMNAMTSVAEGAELTWNAVDGAESYIVLRKSGKKWVEEAEVTEPCYVYEDVSSGKSVTMTVKAVSGEVESTYNTTGKTLNFIAQPEVTLSSTTSGLKVSWAKVSGAAKYRVLMRAENGEWVKVKDTTSTSYTYSKAVHGESYAFTVVCIDSKGKKEVSDYNENGWTGMYVEAPTLGTVTNAAGGVELTWEAVDGAEGYEVLVLSGKKWVEAGETADTKFTYTGASSGKSVTLTVRAVMDGTEGAYNTTGKKITYIAQPKVTLSSTASGLKVSWAKVSGAAKYRVLMLDENGEWVKQKDTTSTSYTYKGAAHGESYSFMVVCIDSKGKKEVSARSEAETGMYVEAPLLGTVTNAADGVELTWNAVEGADGYIVLCKSGSSWVEAGETADTKFTYTGAASGKSVTLTVRAVMDGTEGAYNTTGKKITYVAQPNVTLSNTDKGVKVAWSKVSGASKYRVYLVNADGSLKKLKDTTSTSYTYSNAVNGEAYSFTVVCLNSSGKEVSFRDPNGTGITCER